MEKTKHHLVLSLPYRFHPQIQEEVDTWKIAKRDKRYFYELCRQLEINLSEGRAQPDHIHMPENSTQVWRCSGSKAMAWLIRLIAAWLSLPSSIHQKAGN